MSRDREVVEKVIASLRNIGQFELSPLREGASGASFRAVDPGRRISVSIRTIWTKEFPNSEDYFRNLLAQARGAQALEQSNIAKVIGSGELDGAFFTVSSFVDGRSLRQNLGTGEHLNTWDLIDFARQSCTGLESAHSRGIIHHALHPDNMVLEFDGSTKILDIGFYRGNVPGVDAFHPNAVYLAPEQLAGHGADRHSNFYSIAIMLYEIATGKLPYTGDDWESLAANSQAEIIEAIKLNPQLPPGINAAIMKALSRDRSARYQNGPDFVRALEDYKSFGRSANPAPPRPQRANVVSISGAAVAPARNPFATAPSLAQSDPQIHLQSDSTSAVGNERPAIIGVGEPSGVWRPSVEAPPPTPPIEVEPEPTAPPSRKKQVAGAAQRIGEVVWRFIRREMKRVDPWVLALSVLIIILGSFVARTILLSFYPPPPDGYVTNESVQPPAQPVPAVVAQPAPVAPTPQPEVVAPIAAPVEPPASHPARGISRKAAAPGPALYSASKPLPASAAGLATTGSLEITSIPAGARVIVDGKANQTYTTPQVIPSLLPGVHTFTISKDGYAPATRPVQITSGAQSHLNVQLELPSGFLTVLSNPTTAYILIDGVSTGHVTPSQIPVAPGTHTLTLRKMGYLETSDSFTLKSGEQQSRSVTLLEAGSTPDIRVVQSTGVRKMFGNKVQGVKITVRTTPPGASVAINGQLVPKNTPVEFGLNPGSYTMEIQLAGHPPLRKTITVEAGKPLTLDEILP